MPAKYMTDRPSVRAVYITTFHRRPTYKNVKTYKNNLSAMCTVVTNRTDKNVTYYNELQFYTAGYCSETSLLIMVKR
jgi:cystathionine beta-lyase/cystathionine gamma-synthase